MEVRDIMTSDIRCCTADTPIPEVAALMVECDCGEIPVCDDARRPIGVVTDRDIVCRLVANGDDVNERTAGDCMTEPVVTGRPDMSVEDCANLMERHKVRRIPIVDANGICCGLVAQADLATKASSRQTAEMVEKVSLPGHTDAEAGL